MRLILSRKGFDSASGGGPSPIFPDRSMIALPIPDKSSPIRYSDLQWRGRQLGELVVHLSRGRLRSDYRAHLDPDLRKDVFPREPGWRPTLGQNSSAQGHLRNEGVGSGDLFLFWGLFRRVGTDLAWIGPPEHHIWGWMQVERVVNVDREIRGQEDGWQWVNRHPHLSMPRDPTNTLYVGREALALPGTTDGRGPGYGVFELMAASRRLTAPDSRSPLDWCLPIDFLPGKRRPLTYHQDPGRWSQAGDRAFLRAASRGQEFVLDLDAYPGVLEWARRILGEA